MIKRLAHLCIYTTDLDATAAFYEKTLDMRRAFDFVRDGKPFGYYLSAGETTFIEVFEGEPKGAGSIDHFALEVDDLDAVIQRVRSNGYEVSNKQYGADHAWQAWMTDPNGIHVELHEYTDKSMQLVGGTCVADW